MRPEFIRYNGKDYPAVRCSRCQVLVHPPDAMELHDAMHTLKDMRIGTVLKYIRNRLPRMRENW